jgi:SAM-dependent methyltransferase
MTDAHDDTHRARTPPAQALSRAVGLGDWEDDRLVGLMDAIAPGAGARERPHRKTWEFAMGVLALEEAGLLDDDRSTGLSVGAGHESVLYYLTGRCGRLVATDLYGEGDFARGEAGAMMLTDPDLFAPYPYERDRLEARHMNALDLEYDDASFDFVVSFGSIEHFGGLEAAARALSETGRVLRPGGVAVVTTELATDGAGDDPIPGLQLFAPETIEALVADEPLLDWLGEAELTPPDDGAPVIDLHEEVERVEAGDQSYPHIRLSVRGTDGSPRAFSSVCLALARPEAP